MQDAFFATSKSKKRKRGTGDAPKNKIPRKEKGSKLKKRVADEELDSDRTDEDDNIDDLDLRADDIPESSGDEDIIETPAQKRLRLAKLHLESVKEDLGTCHLDALRLSALSFIYTAEGDYDAAEIDRELISARLRQDVLDQSGKVHLFIADSVSTSQLPQPHSPIDLSDPSTT